MKWTAALIALGTAQIAGANVQAAPDSTIVVTGPSPQQARKQANAYVRELGVANGEQQAARWMSAICPRVVGIEDQQARSVEAHIRSVSRSVGAPLAGKTCDANLLVIFTADADAVVNYLGNHPPGRLGEPGSTSIRRLKEEQAPVRWWYNVGWQNSVGMASGKDSPPGAEFTDYSGNRTAAPGKDVLHSYSASRLSTRAVRGIYAATLVIDVTRINSAGLKSLADYAALVGLAEINLGADPDRSVLSLFKPEGDRYLSERDVSFLSGLYRISMDRDANLQRQMLVNEIVRPRNPVAGN